MRRDGREDHIPWATLGYNAKPLAILPACRRIRGGAKYHFDTITHHSTGFTKPQKAQVSSLQIINLLDRSGFKRRRSTISLQSEDLAER